MMKRNRLLPLTFGVAHLALVGCADGQDPKPTSAEQELIASDIIFSDDFNPQQPAAWSFMSPLPGIMGELNNNANVSGVTLSVDASSAGSGALEFDLLSFRSLDDATSCCTDTLTVTVNGEFALSGAFGDRGTDSFFANPNGAILGPASPIPDGNTRRISLPVTLVMGPNTFTWSYSSLQSFDDEAWGLDNVVVKGASGYRLPFSGTRNISNGPGCTDHVGVQSEAIDYPGTFGVLASDEGTVVFAQQVPQVINNRFGKLIQIQHGDGNISFYAHLSYIAVKQGDPVARGEPIGISGSTGHSTNPHLHFEIRSGTTERTVNPGKGLHQGGTGLSIPRSLPETNLDSQCHELTPGDTTDGTATGP